ncbi:DeoR/GlpR family DNA-binding transcription regulator [Williamsoniiplasma lucivorax]|uniref:DeoR family transcriptional regulator n=1 Tax=Williamsoniiplasma lucivorax TaxID=209274 RepID=A0A2S5R9Y2_9MOLU|nr:DeoR/GlpR family DNA-binding transcription regulator [Williamsoniiplasma lucivorax]PPE04139.1 DeoR family transcriptional regulator [Williamsoniiplasma lucivorax]
MLREERIKLILDFVNQKGYCTNELISKELGIPFTTLRRDLTDLHNESKLRRVHGGAATIKEKSILETNLHEKLALNIEAKRNIAQKALACIKPLETIFLDAGSSTYYLAELIKPEYNNKVYTNSIINAQILAKNAIRDIYLLPGKLKLSTGAICGIETIQALTKYNFDVAFLGINAIDSAFNFYTTDEDEAEIKRTAIKNSQFTFGLGDSSKMNSKSFVKFSDKKEIALISEGN